MWSLFTVTFSLNALLLVRALPQVHDSLSGFDKRFTSLNNICGASNGFICDPKSVNGGACCSGSGFCGNTNAYCGTNCQWDYSANSTGGCGINLQNVCGSKNGDQMCNPNATWVSGETFRGGGCCSGSGYCGNSPDYCTTSNGCDPRYGKCYGSSVEGIKVTTPSQGSGWSLGNLGTFQRKWSWTFNQTLASGTVPSGLSVIEEPTIGSGKYQWNTLKGNVQVNGGYMNLKVPGGQTKVPYSGAEVQTCVGNILYGSFRTRAIVSNTPGTCSGNFFYGANQNGNEIDFEYLSDPKSWAQPNQTVNGVTTQYKGLHFTNYLAPDNDNLTTTTVAPAPSSLNLETTVHEYRVDWTKDNVKFYLDGVLQRTITTIVPNRAGYWILNHWSSGDPWWSYGPPKSDAYFKIQSFTMYYNISLNAGQDDFKTCTGWS